MIRNKLKINIVGLKYSALIIIQVLVGLVVPVDELVGALKIGPVTFMPSVTGMELVNYGEMAMGILSVTSGSMKLGSNT